jgi:small subunit ribosomal protein S1
MTTLPVQQTTPSLLEYLDSGYDYERPQRGEIRQGVIIAADPERVVVDIGAKRDGIVPRQDLDKLRAEEKARLEIGAEVPVYVVQSSDRQGDVIVSVNLGLQQKDWDRAEALLASGEVFEGKVSGFNKGGLLVAFGRIQGFIPMSHVLGLAQRQSGDSKRNPLQAFVGKSLPVKVIEVDRKRRRLVMSARQAEREWREQQKDRLLDELEPGQIRKGIVRSLTNFGAFVDLGGADGLIHVSELSWDKVRHPKDVLTVGQEIEVYVLRLDYEQKRIGLSLKRTQPDPWTTVAEHYQVGQVVVGRITNLADFGAFVQLEPGVEGLIHISELADIPLSHPKELVRKGEQLTLVVLHVDPERRRIGLSLKQAPSTPPTEVGQAYV